ncbi:TRAP transporter small permease subunit, partial [Thalassospira sp.]
MTQRAEKSGGSRLYAAVHQSDRFMNRLTDILAFVGMAALIGAIAIVVVDIIWRRIGGQSLVGAVDLTQFCVMAAASWAIPYAFSAHAHVTVDLIGKNRLRILFKTIDRLIPLLCAG